MYSIGVSTLSTALCLLPMLFLNPSDLHADESQSPTHRTIDLNVGDVVEVELANKTIAKVKLLDVKVVDAAGNVSYDFATILVIDRKLVDQYSPTIHASYWPTFDVRPGDPVTFKVRSFFANHWVRPGTLAMAARW